MSDTSTIELPAWLAAELQEVAAAHKVSVADLLKLALAAMVDDNVDFIEDGSTPTPEPVFGEDEGD